MFYLEIRWRGTWKLHSAVLNQPHINVNGFKLTRLSIYGKGGNKTIIIRQNEHNFYVCYSRFIFELVNTLRNTGMTASSNWSFFRVTGTFCGEFTEHRWLSLTKAGNVDFDVSLVWVRMVCKTNSRMTGDFRLHDVPVTSSWWSDCPNVNITLSWYDNIDQHM